MFSIIFLITKLPLFRSFNKSIIILFLIYFILINSYFFKLHYVDSIYIYFLNNLTNINTNILIILGFICKFFINNKNPTKFKWIFFIYAFMNSNFFFNNLFQFIHFENYDLNSNLLNGLFLIHPILIYVFYAITYTLFQKSHIKINIIKIETHFQLTFNKVYKIQKLIKINFLIIQIAIFLGAWWAFQELNWGTWWNWDLVEIVNLFYVLFFFKFIHHNFIWKIKNSIPNFITFLTNSLLFLFMIRYNLLQSIHSFINIINLNQYIIHFSLLVLVIYSYQIYEYVQVKNNKKYAVNIYSTTNIIIYYVIALFFLLIFLHLNQYLNNFIFLLKKILLIIFTYSIISPIILNFKINNIQLNFFKFINIIYNEFIINLNIYSRYRMVRINKIIHLNIFLLVSICLTFKINYLLNIKLIYNEHLTNQFFFLNRYLHKITQYKLIFNNLTTNNIININVLNHFKFYNEYNTQLSLSKSTLTYWEEKYKNSTHIYLFGYIRELLYINFFIFFIYNKKKKIRKI